MGNVFILLSCLFLSLIFSFSVDSQTPAPRCPEEMAKSNHRNSLLLVKKASRHPCRQGRSLQMEMGLVHGLVQKPLLHNAKSLLGKVLDPSALKRSESKKEKVHQPQK